MLSPIRWFLAVLFFSSLALTLAFGHGLPPATAQVTAPDQLVQEGVTLYQTGDYQGAIARWQAALESYPPGSDLADRALVNENLARAYQQIGDPTAALSAWEAAATAHQQGNNAIAYGRVLSEQAQVLISVGQHQRAAALLCGGMPETTPQTETTATTAICPGGSYAIATTHADGAGQVAALGSLAETYRLTGDYLLAQTLLNAGLNLAKTEGLSQYEAPLLNSLGNTYARLAQVAARRAEAAEFLNVTDQDRSVSETLRLTAADSQAEALRHFDLAIAAAQGREDTVSELRSQLSLLALGQGQPLGSQAKVALDPANPNATPQRIGELIDQLPPSRETAYAAVTLAKAYQPSRDFSCAGYTENPEVSRWLETSRRLAAILNDDRAASFALGELGHLEECRGHLPAALRLTSQAQVAASNALESADSLYLWEWQMGRLHRQAGDIDLALETYAKSITTLNSVRTDILTTDRELQFDFRDTVEPVYRQYIALQLQQATSTTAATKQIVPPPPPPVALTLAAIDSLRLAELQNFFGNDCVLVSSQGVREALLAAESRTTVISSIVLPDRTAIIASFPDGTTQVVEAGDTETLRQTAEIYRIGLKRYRDIAYDQTSSQALYDRLIQPLEKRLKETDTSTLVFVQDGFLRNIPMAALHDGEQYLIQRFALATTPSLELTAPPAPRPASWRALAVGLSQRTVTESGRSFADLNSVPEELESILTQLPGSKTLLNESFTLDNFKAALGESPYSILHLATHGQFSTIPEETFVVTGSGQAGQGQELTFGQLEALIREAAPNAEPIDLITLTACETATGDDRATLGLAGVAIRAGARSAIASLWKVDDATAAQLINNFYANLQNPALSKAQALQAAQVASIETANLESNPGNWAPLILVGNWQ
ncbi:MAG: CHAT domain-containing protein [Nodosilinea sp.]